MVNKILYLRKVHCTDLKLLFALISWNYDLNYLNFLFDFKGYRGEEGQTQQFLVRATFSSIYRPSHLEILVLPLICVLKFLILDDKAILNKSSHVRA